MTASSLYHIVYQSTATNDFSEAGLCALLTQARSWNAAHGITGVLLYREGSILQVLEGTQQEVEYIFSRIAQDCRHRNVTKLADGPIAQRGFPAWSMAFASPQPEELQYLAGYCNPAAANSLPVAHAAGFDSLHDLLITFIHAETLTH